VEDAGVAAVRPRKPPAVQPAALNLREALEWAHHEGWTRAMVELRETHPEAAYALHLAWLRDHPPTILFPELPR
jgi:hypothetical protein